MAAPSARLIAELARESQLRQLSTIDSLDTKASSLIGFAGVVLGLLFTSSLATDRWSIALSVGASLVAVAVIPLAVAVIPRRYRFNPNIFGLYPAWLEDDPEETYKTVTESILRGLSHNNDRIRLKARALRVGVILVVLGVLVVGGALVYAVEVGHSPVKGRTHTTEKGQ
jgi:hypothetical protein